MDRLKQMNTMVQKNGTQMTVEEFSQKYFDGCELEVWKNSKYQVVKRVFRSPELTCGLVHLSIKTLAKSTEHDWREFQTIKNELVGEECEGCELYPAESRKVDTANQYHMWVFESPKMKFPFGFNDGRIIGSKKEASKIGAKQRPIKKRRIK